MAYLLDTVALVTWWGDVASLGRRARAAIEDARNDVFLSAVSVWEIANKNRIGKLAQFDGFAARLPALMQASAFRPIGVTIDHALRGGYLPGAHRDPFDRLLAGQALSEDLTVLTNDREIAAFGCKVLW